MDLDLFPYCLIFIYDLIVSTAGFGHIGPADMIFKTFEECEEPLHQIDVTIKQKKFNRTTDVLDILVYTPVEINNNFFLEYKGSIKKEGGFKPGSFYMKEIACKALSLLLGDIFEQMLNAGGIDDCPLPAGNWSAINFYFDNSKFTVPQLYGEYMMEVFIWQDDVMMSCYKAFYDLLPKLK